MTDDTESPAERPGGTREGQQALEELRICKLSLATANTCLQTFVRLMPERTEQAESVRDTVQSAKLALYRLMELTSPAKRKTE